MGKKLTENELTQVQSMLNAFNQLKLQLGDIELSKKGVFDKIEKVKEDYSVVEKSLSEKYGADAEIDVQTGDIKKKKLQKA
tara:strand:+ start:218 stop:460 length:243 start_codon:yes stop_codon:yes gene_type:complete